jgi:hypothetical protein
MAGKKVVHFRDAQPPAISRPGTARTMVISKGKIAGRYTMGTKKKERWIINPNDLYEVDTAQVRIGYPSFSFFVPIVYIRFQASLDAY